MVNQEDLYKLIYDENWSIIIKRLYENRKDINSDSLLESAANIFETEFFKKILDKPPENKEVIENLEDLYLMHNGKFHLLSNINYKCLVMELVKRKPLKEAYNYATLFPDEQKSKEVIKLFETNVTISEMSKKINPTIEWYKIYNRLFDLINDQNDSATYFSGSRFINTVREFDAYFPNYGQFIDLRNSEGKSTSRKIYYYDILAEMADVIRNQIVDRILEIVRPFKGKKVEEIEVLLGKTPKVLQLNFTDNISDTAGKIEGSPIVFISYSWDNEQHKQWVLDLAIRLVSDGVDVILDRYELKAGRNLPHFVEESIKRANRVLIIFTPNYKLKADKREGGVGYEYSIMNVDLYNNQTNNEKIIPALRAGTKDQSIPTFMQQFIHLDIRNDDNIENSYKDLLREIYNEPYIVKPVLGTKPIFK